MAQDFPIRYKDSELRKKRLGLLLTVLPQVVVVILVMKVIVILVLVRGGYDGDGGGYDGDGGGCGGDGGGCGSDGSGWLHLEEA